jgi:DNA polymerase-3 subunit alpha
VQEGKIVFGLIGIKNVGSAAVEEIIRERTKHGPFSSIIDFLSRVGLKLVNKKVMEALILAGVFDCLKETRATLFQNLERLMSIASLRQEQRTGGQALLFADLDSDDFATLRLEKVPEWPKMKLLIDEHDILGFFFSGHPLDKYRPQIEKYTTLNAQDKESLVADRTYVMIGLIKNIKEIVTKTGKRMAFAELEDFRGKIEMVIFSDVFEKAKDLLKENEVRAVQGKIDTSRGEPKLKADEIFMPEDLSGKKATAVHIKLSREYIDEENSYKLRDFLSEKKGPCHIYFHIMAEGAGGEKVIKASTQLSVSADPDVLFKLKQYPQVIDVWSE